MLSRALNITPNSRFPFYKESHNKDPQFMETAIASDPLDASRLGQASEVPQPARSPVQPLESPTIGGLY